MVVELQTPTTELLLVSIAAIWEPESKKVNTITSTNRPHNKLVGGLTLKEKSHLRETSSITGICLKMHLALRFLLLWNSHCFPQDQPWWYNHIMLTKCCKSHIGGRHCNSPSDGWCPGPYNHHRWSNSGCSNWRHKVKHTKKKKHPLYKFPTAEDRNTSRNSNNQYPWEQQTQQHLAHDIYMDIWQTHGCQTDIKRNIKAYVNQPAVTVGLLQIQLN